jgi:hypothetical protein
MICNDPIVRLGAFADPAIGEDDVDLGKQVSGQYGIPTGFELLNELYAKFVERLRHGVPSTIARANPVESAQTGKVDPLPDKKEVAGHSRQSLWGALRPQRPYSIIRPARPRGRSVDGRDGHDKSRSHPDRW